MRVEIVDGRTFVGTLICLDKQKNVILKDCTEHSKRSMELKSGKQDWESSRYLGLVLVPGMHITHCQIALKTPASAEQGVAQLTDGIQQLQVQ